MTVSKAIRNRKDVAPGTRARILQAVKELGYVPDFAARGLRTRKTGLLGVLVSSLTSPVFSRVVLAIEERAHDLGYDVVVGQSLDNPDREEACIRRFLARGLDGVFVVPAYRMQPEAPVYKDLASRGTPTVVLGHTAPFCAQFVNVETDDLLASYALTAHLLKLGHKRIAFFSGPSAAAWSQERFEGYRRALREYGLDVDDKLVFQAGRGIDDGANTALQMINESCNATAVQAVNDILAIGCIETFLKQGLNVPNDISVVGFGNILLSQYYKVPLTTARQPKYRLGAAAVELMQQLLAGAQPAPKRLPAELIVRASSGTPPATSVLKRALAAANTKVPA